MNAYDIREWFKWIMSYGALYFEIESNRLKFIGVAKPTQYGVGWWDHDWNGKSLHLSLIMSFTDDKKCMWRMCKQALDRNPKCVEVVGQRYYFDAQKEQKNRNQLTNNSKIWTCSTDALRKLTERRLKSNI